MLCKEKEQSDRMKFIPRTNIDKRLSSAFSFAFASTPRRTNSRRNQKSITSNIVLHVNLDRWIILCSTFVLSCILGLSLQVHYSEWGPRHYSGAGLSRPCLWSRKELDDGLQLHDIVCFRGIPLQLYWVLQEKRSTAQSTWTKIHHRELQYSRTS